MKKIIIIALLITGCKKQASVEPTKVVVETPQAVPDKTVTVYSKAYGGYGWIKINWKGDNNLSNDSSYAYSLSKYTTKILQTDSIDLYFYSQACGSCSYDPNDIVVTVNGIVKYNTTNHFGNQRININL